MKTPIAAALLLLPCTAMGQPAPDAAAEVRAARLAQNAAIAARQFDSMATFWTTDVVIVSSRGGVLRGKEAYREAFAGDSSMIIYGRTPDRIDVSAAWPLAWEEGTWVGQVGTSGPVLIGGRYAAQWHRIGGRWLIRSEVFVGLRCSGDPCGWPVQSP
jgi:ketosteroid isomerase-like protein